jgi:hypothetical protein
MWPVNPTREGGVMIGLHEVYSVEVDAFIHALTA